MQPVFEVLQMFSDIDSNIRSTVKVAMHMQTTVRIKRHTAVSHLQPHAVEGTVLLTNPSWQSGCLQNKETEPKAVPRTGVVSESASLASD